MSLQERIPELTDVELANLRANATRLETAGTPRQQTDAAALLPLVDAELARRREAASARKAAVARAAPRKAPAKRAAKAKPPVA
ncbi:MAG: hypothetical protein JNJ73_00825 [Hyphomonadaceae bacterium]|nr:hypothetical protein [Hyphomonadaceae bacterium]